MLRYLYYKIYKATLKGSLKDIPHIAAPIYLGGLIGINILVVYLFLVKIDVVPYVLKKAGFGGVFIAIMIAAAMLYFNKERRELILEKYSDEQEVTRKWGNRIVVIYVVLSFLLIFVVGFFRPGKL